MIGTQAFLYSWRGKEGEDKGKEIVSVYIAQTTDLVRSYLLGILVGMRWKNIEAQARQFSLS